MPQYNPFFSGMQTNEQQEEIPPAQSQAYADFIIRYNYNINRTQGYVSDVNFQIISEDFAVLYLPFATIPSLEVSMNTYNAIPKCYTYMDMEALDASGITALQNHPYLNLRGRGTLIAVIDSGIDYTNPVFREGDRTRILRIWDQSLLGQETDMSAVPYGREFTEEQINEALASEEPLALVPSVDGNGHGTMVAGVAAGGAVLEEGFSGAAPEASLLIVKLKPAKDYLRSFYLIPEGADAYQENDIMLAVAYVLRIARELQLPMSICIGLGSSQGAHTGEGFLESYLSLVSLRLQNCVAVAAGNEGNSRNHYQGNINIHNRQDVVELRIDERERGFIMELWGDSFRDYRFQMQSPTGEILPISTTRGSGLQTLAFVFVETKIEVSYVPMEAQTGQVLVFFRFLDPAPGIWKLLVEATGGNNEDYHIWLPVQGFVSEATYFLRPSPYQTVTNPGNARNVLTMTAYNIRDRSLYLQASRGYTTTGVVKPDLAAPGVGVLAPLRNGRFALASGSSVSAAQAAGAAALLLEWGIVRGNEINLNGIIIRNYLRRGASRSENMEYPNPEWGYGRMNVYRTLELSP
ncbi:MAG: S8 family peptidase [Eubacteriales bacterium]|nr:S8 family peptidase [Eubacteriales bacterium]